MMIGDGINDAPALARRDGGHRVRRGFGSGEADGRRGDSSGGSARGPGAGRSGPADHARSCGRTSSGRSATTPSASCWRPSVYSGPSWPLPPWCSRASSSWATRSGCSGRGLEPASAGRSSPAAAGRWRGEVADESVPRRISPERISDAVGQAGGKLCPNAERVEERGRSRRTRTERESPKGSRGRAGEPSSSTSLIGLASCAPGGAQGPGRLVPGHVANDMEKREQQWRHFISAVGDAELDRRRIRQRTEFDAFGRS